MSAFLLIKMIKFLSLRNLSKVCAKSMVQTASVFSMLEICQMLLLACLQREKKKRNQSTHTLVLENTSILIWGRVLDLHANLSAIDAVMNDTYLKKSLSNIQHTELVLISNW
jgi:hypothetical protein